MRKEEQTAQAKRKAYTFLFIIGLITIIFVIVLIAMVFRGIKFKSYQDIAKRGLTITGQEVFKLKDGDYYVFFYSSAKENQKINYDKQDSLEPYIANYFTFVKQNKHKQGVCQIRLLDVDNSKNSFCLYTSTTSSAQSWDNFTIDESSLPALMYLTVDDAGSGQYRYSYDIYTEESQIKSQLSNSISSVITVAYIPPKKELELL